jgi:single-strand DNA-binding protein
MANDLNQCNFIGRLGKDVETRYTQSGTAISSFSMAVGEKWKDKNTNQQNEHTEWVNVEAFGKLAEIMGQYLSKGSQVFINGKLKTDSWDDKQTGEKKYRTKIIANNMQMLGGKGEGQQQQHQGGGHQSGQQQGGGFQHQQGGGGQQGGFQQSQQQQQGGFQQGNQQNTGSQQGQQKPGGFDDFDDDIPF